MPGTAAAQRAQDLEAARAAHPPHVLLDTDRAAIEARPRVGLPKGMSAEEIADRIVATLLQGTGPILLCVPGTLGKEYQSSMLAIARSFIAEAGRSVSVASIPYPNGIPDVVGRFVTGPPQARDNVLALVLGKLRAAAPGRPILLTGESQGAWLIADTLRADPALAAAVTRIALFAKPGFVEMPAAIGAARAGASMLPGTASGVPGILEYRHTDDIVPSLFRHLHPRVLMPYVESLTQGRGLEYPPHHYDWHGSEAARFLLFGETPAEPEVHRSTAHPTHAPDSGRA